ncbi:MAG TPA: hypothetical protein VGX00_04870 [Thermoplasmata archaeon]|nr:hypothetical protein [Thermoplasmata archaeon]
MTEIAKSWGTCTYCGDAVPPDVAKCPTCGNARSVGPGRPPAMPGRERRHLRLVQGVRLTLVVGVVGLLAYLMVSAAFVPPASVSDPLTTRGPWVIGPGNFTALGGEVTGDDYVVGNYSVNAPAGAPVSFLVFNNTEFSAFSEHRNATPIDRIPATSHAQIVFSAPYTDTFHFVWVNGYAPTTGIVLTVFVVTNYESNALVE